MSKLRIYELAKELGVNNNIVIEKAKELGMTGKSSHSHSLEADEIDLIKRAILRHDVEGGAKASTSSAAGFVVRRTGAKVQEPVTTTTTRVDKDTGVTESVVEKRQGNVIRRRRQVDDVVSAGAQNESISEIYEQNTHDEQVVSDIYVPAIEEIEETFETSEVLAIPIPIVENIIVTKSRALPEVKAVIPEIIAERKTIGPKILGRIELPTRKVITSAVRGGKLTLAEEEEAKKALLKKNKKREFTRDDLVDYESSGAKAARAAQPSQSGDQALECVDSLR